MRAALATASFAAAAAAAAQPPAPGFADPLLGRWDLTIEAADGAYPSWLEVRLRTEGELMGRFVGRVGSARYVDEIGYAAGRVTFRVPVQYETDIDALRFEGMLRGERIEGTTLAANSSLRSALSLPAATVLTSVSRPEKPCARLSGSLIRSMY